ncbi:hypothetical protein KDL01_13360 [Actinospica durhamensis]|uniref:Uncharacterized protein n=1 Tax=Actinospica durhamensis TaxID=1508375 RepID=A0A941EM80_9ACTN|nr:hypothetical protein [Actinospica durhamensis]MBR7834257.1 hypothetical protein [Actinospica durhamensis]
MNAPVSELPGVAEMPRGQPVDGDPLLHVAEPAESKGRRALFGGFRKPGPHL